VASDADSLRGKLTSTAYFEAYYGSDELGGLAKSRPDFFYNHTSVNRAAINLTFLKSTFTNYRFRMNVAFMAGTYASKNLAAEDEIFRNLFEANMGIGLNRKENLWIELGVFPSHIGMESAIGWDNPTLTRCLVSENSPYYESGVKLSWKHPNGKWYAALLGLNGWQRISVENDNIMPGGGSQVTYDNGTLKVNYSTFLGDISPTSNYRVRFYQNLFAQYRFNERCVVFGGFDLGMQQQPTLVLSDHAWYSWFGIVQYKISDRMALALRAEQFNDPEELLVLMSNDQLAEGAALYAASLNADYRANKHLLLRLEVKNVASSNNEKIRYEPRNLLSNYFGVTVSVCAGF
jgi:hypothetical protein